MSAAAQLAQPRRTAIGASIEIQPKRALSTADLADLIPAGCRVYLVDVGTDPLDTLVAASRRLVDIGLVPVPHIPARRMTTLSEFEHRVGRLAQEGGAHDMLVIGGGLDRPVGNFPSSMELLETGFFDRFGVTDIAVAGHPEGNPDFSQAIAEDSLRQKWAFAERTGARMRVVTQFGFDPEKFIRWSEGLRQAGIDLPVHLGVAGPAKLTTLIKYAIACGVGPSLSFLKKKNSILSALTTNQSPEGTVEPFEAYRLAHPDGAIVQIHVFPFGGLRPTSACWPREDLGILPTVPGHMPDDHTKNQIDLKQKTGRLIDYSLRSTNTSHYRNHESL